MRRQQLKSLEVSAAAQASFNKELQARLARSVWLAGGCGSWYVNKDGEGSSGGYVVLFGICAVARPVPRVLVGMRGDERHVCCSCPITQ
jgi:hypothetical protein